MDYIVSMLVRLMVFLARFARSIPGIELSRWEPGKKLRILLVGYNGKRNTGADARVECIVEQLERIFGAENVEISVMTIDPEATKSYFGPRTRQIPVGTIFFIPTLRECSRSHMAILVEGSTFKSTFANALTLYFCEAAGVMRAQGKPCVAYGSEAGQMDGVVKRTVARLCSDVRFVGRTQESLDIMRSLGIEGTLGTDTAWTFDGSSYLEEVEGSLRSQGWNGSSPLIGVAPVNPFHWPVKPSLGKLVRACASGDFSQCYEKWYFHSWSPQRALKLEAYLEALARSVSRWAEQTAANIVVVGMEAVDSEVCFQLRDRISRLTGGRVPLFLSREVDAGPMAALLNKLSILVTSRYHAQVLAMARPVPTVSVSMDERLGNIAKDIGLAESMLISVNDPRLEEALDRALEHAVSNESEIKDRLSAYRDRSLEAFDLMAGYLLEVVRSSFPGLCVSGKGNQFEGEMLHAS